MFVNTAGVCDVLAMLCFRPARSGGLSKMASARKIHELLQQQPRVRLGCVRFVDDQGSVVGNICFEVSHDVLGRSVNMLLGAGAREKFS